jgi:hypothetical protein
LNAVATDIAERSGARPGHLGITVTLLKRSAPNPLPSCNQYCDGDFISGPEVMSCSDHVRRKREASAQATKARQDQIDRENRKADAERQRRQQVQDDRIEAERRRQADLDYANKQQELAAQKLDLEKRAAEQREAQARADAQQRAEENRLAGAATPVEMAEQGWRRLRVF